MGKIQVIKTEFSTVWKGVKNKCLRTKTSNPFAESKNIPTPKDLPLDEFVGTTPKLPRPITIADKYNFRLYLLGKRLDLKVTPQEIKELFTYEGEEYKLKAFEFLTKKMNIPKEIISQFVYSDAKNGAAMFYDYSLNCIFVNPSLNADKSQFLVLLRHELQHFSQNMEMFRHETKGIELAEIFSKMNAKINSKNIDHYARNVDIEQLKQILNEEDLKQISYLKDLLGNNKINEYDDYMQLLEKKLTDYHMSAYTDFRNKVIKNLGVLKKDTKEGKRAEKMFNETVAEQSYWKQDGSIDIGAYYGDIREIEAIAAQDMIALRLNAITSGNDKYCYIKILRETQENMQKNIDKLDPQLQELLKTKKDNEIAAKKIAYLFN